MSLLPPGRHTTPSLKLLAEYWLNEDMHSGVHDSVQDATVALRLYLLHALEWEKAVSHQVAPCCTAAASDPTAPWLWGFPPQAAGVWAPWPLPKVDGIRSQAAKMDHSSRAALTKEASKDCVASISPAGAAINSEQEGKTNYNMHGLSRSPASSVALVQQFLAVDVVGTEVSKCHTTKLTSNSRSTLPTVVPDFWAEATPMTITFISSCLVVCVVMMSRANPKNKEIALQTLAFELSVCLFRAALAFSSGWAFGPFCTGLFIKVGALVRSKCFEYLNLVHADFEQILWYSKNHRL
jgi:hypothetical protein